MAALSTYPAAPEQARPAAAHTGFRPDIEGLRAIAVGLVVLSHAGVAGLAGGYVGVDVFFVISGFLITTLLVKELTRTGTISLSGFYARRATRLLPASTLVLVATLAGAWFFLPPTRFRSISLDALFSTFYGINWRLADEGVQYLNADAAPSPLQHFWSLAVEEQFYLVWPLLILLCALISGRGRTVGRRVLIAVMCVLVAASLVVSITQTDSSAPWAYFGAHTRAWELGIGALVALAGTRTARLPGALAAPLTWAGVVAVVASALIYDEHTAFPGYAAALPVLGSAAIIAGGTAAARGGAGVLLGTVPFQLIGRYSYSWYLWHWPVLMIGPAALGVQPSIKVNGVLALGALGLAVASYHLVENPVRNRAWIKSRASRGIGIGLGLSAGAAALALVAGLFTPPLPAGAAAIDTTATVASAADPQAVLSRLIAESADDRVLPANLTPEVDTMADPDQSPEPYRVGCHLTYSDVTGPGECVYGDPNGTRTMYLVGDSHGAHWFPALNIIAKERGWRLATRTKSACQAASVLTYSAVLKRTYRECAQWRDGVLDEIARTRPALVVLASTGMDENGLYDSSGARIDKGPDRDQLWVRGWSDTVERVRSPQTRVVLIQDTPWPAGNTPECVSANPEKLTACRRPVAKAVFEPARRKLVAAAARAEDVTVIDPTPWFCTAKQCPAVVGNLLVFRDHSHLTNAYSEMLVPILKRELPRAG